MYMMMRMFVMMIIKNVISYTCFQEEEKENLKRENSNGSSSNGSRNVLNTFDNLIIFP